MCWFDCCGRLPHSTRDGTSIPEFVACIDPPLHIADYRGERNLIKYGPSGPSKEIQHSSLLISKIREYSYTCLQIIRELWISSMIQWRFVLKCLSSIEESHYPGKCYSLPQTFIVSIARRSRHGDDIPRTHVNFRDSRWDCLKRNDRSPKFLNLPSHAMEKVNTDISIVRRDHKDVRFGVLLLLTVSCH